VWGGTLSRESSEVTEAEGVPQCRRQYVRCRHVCFGPLIAGLCQPLSCLNHDRSRWANRPPRAVQRPRATPAPHRAVRPVRCPPDRPACCLARPGRRRGNRAACRPHRSTAHAATPILRLPVANGSFFGMLAFPHPCHSLRSCQSHARFLSHVTMCNVPTALRSCLEIGSQRVRSSAATMSMPRSGSFPRSVPHDCVRGGCLNVCSGVQRSYRQPKQRGHHHHRPGRDSTGATEPAGRISSRVVTPPVPFPIRSWCRWSRCSGE
jgi:hypothetical protein